MEQSWNMSENEQIPGHNSFGKKIFSLLCTANEYRLFPPLTVQCCVLCSLIWLYSEIHIFECGPGYLAFNRATPICCSGHPMQRLSSTTLCTAGLLLQQQAICAKSLCPKQSNIPWSVHMYHYVHTDSDLGRETHTAM